MFFWNRREREGGWLCCGTPRGVVHFVASVKSTSGVVLCVARKAVHTRPGERTRDRAMVLREEGESRFLGERPR